MNCARTKKSTDLTCRMNENIFIITSRTQTVDSMHYQMNQDIFFEEGELWISRREGTRLGITIWV